MLTVENEHKPSYRKQGRSFDSLAFAKQLQAGGAFTREQAEILAEQQAALIDERLATKEDIEGLRLATQKDIEGLRLATQKDIEGLRLATQKDIEALRISMTAEIEKAKSEVLKWMFGQTVFLLTSLAGIVALLIHVNKP